MTTKYSKGLTRRIAKAVSFGTHYKTAAEACGLSEATFWVFMKKYPEFQESLKRARAISIAKKIVIIHEDKSIETAKWWLERVDRENWSLPTLAEKDMRDLIGEIREEIKRLKESKHEQTTSRITISD